ncbi:hypothetical protein C8F01DRAFT_1244429 [Mycena amicta]|nr:hypothetical protein C8F01DRAFT_1244429 [Mycena amicta]
MYEDTMHPVVNVLPAPTYGAILVPVGAVQPTVVQLPLLLGTRIPASPRDLDVTRWILRGTPPHFMDLDANSVDFTFWPLHSSHPLPHAYTIFCAAQSETANDSNDCVASFAKHVRPKWKGNILVARALHGTEGIGSMTLADWPNVEDIVRHVVKERVIGTDASILVTI